MKEEQRFLEEGGVLAPNFDRICPFHLKLRSPPQTALEGMGHLRSQTMRHQSPAVLGHARSEADAQVVRGSREPSQVVAARRSDVCQVEGGGETRS